MDALSRPAVVMDCGSGYTKLGFAGSTHPAVVLPTAIACNEGQVGVRQGGSLLDLDLHIGEEAYSSSAAGGYVLRNPIRQGKVESWDDMERYWQQCFWQQLGVNPQEHYCVLTEPVLNTPADRESMAEIMFETFNVPGLYMEVDAILSLCASVALESHTGGSGEQLHTGMGLTGTVIDAGDGTTSIIPVVDGYVLAGFIRNFPVAGRDVTLMVQQMLRDRDERVPPSLSMDVARRIKETMGYVCGDMHKEVQKYTEQPDKYHLQYAGVNPKTGREFVVGVGQERFLGPEMFFNPEILTSSSSPSLPSMVDAVIQKCPIDTRRSLYGNIVLSGGSTMLKNFSRRLQRDLTAVANARIGPGATQVDVNVVSHSRQRHAAWLGGSIVATGPEFPAKCVTWEQYQEQGVAACRSNSMFKDA